MKLADWAYRSHFFGRNEMLDSAAVPLELAKAKLYFFITGAPVSQRFKCWPADVAVVGSIPGRGNLFDRKRGSTAHNLSLSSVG